MSLTAKDIVELLGAKHSSDVWIPECKDGQTWGRGHSRLDGWAMKRSWSPLTMIGYEVKVSRSDFVNDDKWPLYLPLCNQLYFVCPHGVIDPSEVPKQCGLLVAAKTGTRLYTKKKAPHRDIAMPGDLMAYALMRADGFTTMGQHREGSDRMTAKDWAEWRDGNREMKRLGRDISRSLAEKYRRDVERVERDNERLLEENRGLQKIKEAADRLGITLSRWSTDRQISEKLRGDVPAEFRHQLQRLVDDAKRTIDHWDRLAKRGEAEVRK